MDSSFHIMLYVIEISVTNNQLYTSAVYDISHPIELICFIIHQNIQPVVTFGIMYMLHNKSLILINKLGCTVIVIVLVHFMQLQALLHKVVLPMLSPPPWLMSYGMLQLFQMGWFIIMQLLTNQFRLFREKIFHPCHHPPFSPQIIPHS